MTTENNASSDFEGQERATFFIEKTYESKDEVLKFLQASMLFVALFDLDVISTGPHSFRITDLDGVTIGNINYTGANPID